MGRRRMGKPRRSNQQRFEGYADIVRRLLDAGSPRVVRDAVEGRAVSGARRKYPLPSIGHRSGKLTVTGYVKGERGGVSALIIKCACGRPEYAMAQNSFKNFAATRCVMCGRDAATDTRKRYHGYAEELPDDAHRERLLNRLSSAIGRCHNPRNKAFAHYGERGVTVWQGWRDNRGEFLRYVQTLPDWDVADFEMDRVDVNGNYEPGNIQFVSRKQNLGNKRRIADLEARIRELEARLRHCKCGAAASVHDCN